VVDDKGVRPRGELAAADAGVLVGQVRTDQGKRELDRREVRQESLLRRVHLLIRPVVAQPVAVAVPAGEALLVGIAGVVALPVAGLSEHPALHNLRKVRPIGIRDELLLDGCQGEQRLAQGKGEPRPDLEDRPVVLDERGERLDGLVVG